MIHHLIELILPPIISIIELVGIFVVVWGSVVAFYHYLVIFFKPCGHEIKLELAESLATGLEFKMAAEILRTVLIQDFNEIAVLAAIIGLRAVLAFMIHWEMSHYHKKEA